MKHAVVHFEIPADDMERAKAFYEELFGWKINAALGCETYWPFKPLEEEDLEGAVVKRLPFFEGPLFYIQVESVEDYAAKIEALGGTIILPKDPVPGICWIVVFKDTEGNTFALVEFDPQAG